MNTFVIYQNETTILKFICDKLPSQDNKYLILLTLDNSNFESLDYEIWTIPNNDRNRAFKFEGYHKTTDEFMKEFLKICDGSCLFGVKLYLK